MKCLERNKQTFYYSLYESKEAIKDEYGNVTGEYEIIRGNPQMARANISAAKGEVDSNQFGENLAYDRVVIMEDADTDIDEYTVMWVDTMPILDESGATDTPYDYIVKKVARSINSVSIAISKVDVQ